MKKSELEILLQRAPPHPNPKASLEQYMTPAPEAAEMLFFAAQTGDIIGKVVGDLGCGTGILAAGAGILGASKVVGIDIDGESVEVARKFVEELRQEKNVEFELDFVVGRLEDFHEEVDTIVMNPPFGAQRRHADRPFLQKAFETAHAVYSFHMSETWEFVEREARGAGFTVTHRNKYKFAIKHMFEFHRKERELIEVTLFRMERGR
jgi:putative methylase